MILWIVVMLLFSVGWKNVVFSGEDLLVSIFSVFCGCWKCFRLCFLRGLK